MTVTRSNLGSVVGALNLPERRVLAATTSIGAMFLAAGPLEVQLALWLLGGAIAAGVVALASWRGPR
jgi:hypothetical protein